MNTSSILKTFGLDTDNCELTPLGDGLINTTWVIKETSTNKAFPEFDSWEIKNL